MDFSALSGIAGLPFGRGFSPQQPVRKGGRGGAHKKQCNCKNSRCLKLYCECFASGRYCEGCNCSNCFNNHENEQTRQAAVEAILERNPNAFRPKIQAGDDGARGMQSLDAVGKHSKGCNCKKSACLKKYCECFQAGVFCSDSCKCIECKNYEGSEQRAQVIACINMQPGHVSIPSLMMDPTSPSALASPLKRMRTMSGAIPGLGMAMPGQQYNAATAAALAALKPPGLPQPAASTRPILHQVVGDILKGNVIEELCRLLFLVADEEADKQLQAAQGTGQAAQAEGQQQGEASGSSGSSSSGAAEGTSTVAVKTETGVGGSGGGATDGGAVLGNGGGAANTAAAARAKQLKQLSVAQERVVLEEFHNMFRKMTDTANKKAVAQQQAAAAQAAQAVAAAANGQHAAGAGLNYAAGISQAQLMAAVAAMMARPQAALGQAAGALRPSTMAGLTSQQAAALAQYQSSLLLPQSAASATAPGLAGGFDAAIAAAAAAAAGGGVSPSFTSMLHDQTITPQLLRELAVQSFGGLGGGSTSMAGTLDTEAPSHARLQSQSSSQPAQLGGMQHGNGQSVPMDSAVLAQLLRQQVPTGGQADASAQLAYATLLNMQGAGTGASNHRAVMAGADAPEASMAGVLGDAGGLGLGGTLQGRNSSSPLLPPAHAP